MYIIDDNIAIKVHNIFDKNDTFNISLKANLHLLRRDPFFKNHSDEELKRIIKESYQDIENLIGFYDQREQSLNIE